MWETKVAKCYLWLRSMWRQAGPVLCPDQYHLPGCLCALCCRCAARLSDCPSLQCPCTQPATHPGEVCIMTQPGFLSVVECTRMTERGGVVPPCPATQPRIGLIQRWESAGQPDVRGLPPSLWLAHSRLTGPSIIIIITPIYCVTLITLCSGKLCKHRP